MSKILFKVIMIVGLAGGVTASKAASRDEAIQAIQEEWKMAIRTNINDLYQSSADADFIDNNQFPKTVRSHQTVEAALDFLLSQYPPLEGGLYTHYKREVDGILKHGMSFYEIPKNSWYAPWNFIAMQTLGSGSPYDEIGGLIALWEIRRLPEYELLYKCLLKMNEVSQTNALTHSVGNLSLSPNSL